MSLQAAQLEEDRSQYQEQLDLVLSSLQDDPGNAELQVLKEELESALQMIVDSLAELGHENGKGNAATSSSITPTQSQPGPPPPSSSLLSPSNTSSHPPSAALSAGPPPAVVYKVNDNVLARWVSGDKAFYPARIMSVTGSAAAPMYTVKFKSYNETETLRARELRPVAASASAAAAAAATTTTTPSTASKRHADGLRVDSSSVASPPLLSSATMPSPTQPPPPPPPPPSFSSSASATPTSSSYLAQPPPPPPLSASSSAAAPSGRPFDRFQSGIVSSASAQLYSNTQSQHGSNGAGSSGSGAGDDDGPPTKKFRRIKATKKLEAGKSKWQDFNNKSKFGKAGTKKESMFRTPEGIHGRVGFTGSGQTMRKDPTRSRHVHQANEELD